MRKIITILSLMILLGAVGAADISSYGNIVILNGFPVPIEGELDNVRFFLNEPGAYFEYDDADFTISKDEADYVCDFAVEGAVTVVMLKPGELAYLRTSKGLNFMTGALQNLVFGGASYKSFYLAKQGEQNHIKSYNMDAPPGPQKGVNYAWVTFEGYAPETFKPIFTARVKNYGAENNRGKYELVYPRYRYELWWDGTWGAGLTPEAGAVDNYWRVDPAVLPDNYGDKIFTFKIFAHTHYAWTDSTSIIHPTEGNKDVTQKQSTEFVITAPDAGQIAYETQALTLEAGLNFFGLSVPPPWYAYSDAQLTQPIDVGSAAPLVNKIENAYHLLKAIKETAGDSVSFKAFGYWGKVWAQDPVNPAVSFWNKEEIGVLPKGNDPDGESKADLQGIMLEAGAAYQVYLESEEPVELIISNQPPAGE